MSGVCGRASRNALSNIRSRSSSPEPLEDGAEGVHALVSHACGGAPHLGPAGFLLTSALRKCRALAPFHVCCCDAMAAILDELLTALDSLHGDDDPRHPRESVRVMCVAALSLNSSRMPCKHLSSALSPSSRRDVSLSSFQQMRDVVLQHDAYGHTLLHEAAEEGNAAGILLLLACGADPLLESCDGCIPLHLTARGGHLQCACALLEGSRRECFQTLNDDRGSETPRTGSTWCTCVSEQLSARDGVMRWIAARHAYAKGQVDMFRYLESIRQHALELAK